MNKALLEYEIKRKGMSIGGFCEKIKMSRSAFYRKCNGIAEFTQGEIQTIIDVLGIKSPVDIFFTPKVS